MNSRKRKKPTEMFQSGNEAEFWQLCNKTGCVEKIFSKIKDELTNVSMKITNHSASDNDTASNGVGCCGIILIFISFLFVFMTFPLSIWLCIKIVKEYERAVIFRLGRIGKGGAKGPGIFWILPCTDSFRHVDLRTVSFNIPPQEVLTRDSVTIMVDAVVYYRVFNPTVAITKVENADMATRMLAQTTLRNMLGTKNLSEILTDREEMADQMEHILYDASKEWGIKVERVELKDVKLPEALQRAMAAEAEASRDARAKVIAAEGEMNASRALKEAALVMADAPSSLQLRYLQTLTEIASERNSTIVFPIPIDFMSSFMKKTSDDCEKFTKLKFHNSFIGTTLDVKLLLYTNDSLHCGRYTDPKNISASLPFDATKKMTFVIHGYRPTGSPPVWIERIVHLLIGIEDMNVIVVDWNRGAATLNYPKAAENTRKVADILETTISQLVELGTSLSSIHLIGVSLGAHVAGFIGSRFNGTIGRITGLDPAGPLFTGRSPKERLDPNDAMFVDVLHTDIDALGYREPLGHIDFYANGGTDQPGCPRTILAERKEKTKAESAGERAVAVNPLYSTNTGPMMQHGIDCQKKGKASKFEQYTETKLLAQFDKGMNKIQKISIKFSTGNVIGPRYKLRVIRLKLRSLENDTRLTDYCPLLPYIRHPKMLQVLVAPLLAAFPGVVEEMATLAQEQLQRPLAPLDPNKAVDNPISHEALRESEALLQPMRAAI
ncbi:STOM protein, partial [Polypterus senegalus]